MRVDAAKAYLVVELEGQAAPLEGATFALDVTRVDQVLEAGRLTEVPLAPGVVRGIMGHHGRIVTVVDPAPLLDLAAQPAGVQHVVIVQHRRGRLANLGFQAASIRGIVPAGQLEEVNVAPRANVAWVAQMDKRLVHILALDSLLGRLAERISTLAGGAKESNQGVVV